MGYAGKLLITDSGRNGDAWLSRVGVSQHGQPRGPESHVPQLALLM